MLPTDTGSLLYPVPCITNLAHVAGDTQDGVEQTGLVIDRESAELKRGKRHHEAMLVIGLHGLNIATLETVSIVANLEHDDNVGFSSPADFAPPVPPVGDHPTVATARTYNGGEITAGSMVLTHSYDLKGAERYLRVVYTATFSASSTDTGNIAGFLVFGGFAEQPIGPLTGALTSVV